MNVTSRLKIAGMHPQRIPCRGRAAPIVSWLLYDWHRTLPEPWVSLRQTGGPLVVRLAPRLLLHLESLEDEFTALRPTASCCDQTSRITHWPRPAAPAGASGSEPRAR